MRVEAGTPAARPSVAVDTRHGRSAGVRRLEAQLTQTGAITLTLRYQGRHALLRMNTFLVAFEVALQSPARRQVQAINWALLTDKRKTFSSLVLFSIYSAR